MIKKQEDTPVKLLHRVPILCFCKCEVYVTIDRMPTPSDPSVPYDDGKCLACGNSFGGAVLYTSPDRAPERDAHASEVGLRGLEHPVALDGLPLGVRIWCCAKFAHDSPPRPIVARRGQAGELPT